MELKLPQVKRFFFLEKRNIKRHNFAGTLQLY